MNSASAGKGCLQIRGLAKKHLSTQVEDNLFLNKMEGNTGEGKAWERWGEESTASGQGTAKLGEQSLEYETRYRGEPAHTQGTLLQAWFLKYGKIQMALQPCKPRTQETEAGAAWFQQLKTSRPDWPQQNPVSKEERGCWKDGSAVKSAKWLTAAGFCPKHPHQALPTACNFSSRDLTPSSGLRRQLHACSAHKLTQVHIHTEKQINSWAVGWRDRAREALNRRRRSKRVWLMALRLPRANSGSAVGNSCLVGFQHPRKREGRKKAVLEKPCSTVHSSHSRRA